MAMAQNSEKQRQEPLSILAADPNNARTISPESMRGLSVSIETFGDLSGVVFNTRTGHLVCGHQRVSALREAGATEWVNDGAKSFVEHPVTKERFGVRLVDWDETTERMANLTANNPSLQGEFTAEALEQLRQLESESDFAGLGLDVLERELASSLKELEGVRPVGAEEQGDLDATKDIVLLQCPSCGHSWSR
jgi:ParB-like chromosome segregation protein Spo0J